MLTSGTTVLVAAVGLLSCCPPFGSGQETGAPSVWTLQREVQQRERDLTKAQRALAEARARLALAQGRREVAVAELRNAVGCYQAEVQWIRDHANWFCDPREPMTEAQWNLAKARAWLAEVDGDAAALVAECKKIVGFHRERVQVVRRLEQMRVVGPKEVSQAEETLGKAEQRLEAAEKRLSADQANKPDKPK